MNQLKSTILSTVRPLLVLLLALFVMTPHEVRAASKLNDTTATEYLGDGATADTEAEGKFIGLQTRLKSLAVIILVIMLIVAAIMAAFQKTGMALSVAIAAIILFGGIFLLGMIQRGLEGAAGGG